MLFTYTLSLLIYPFSFRYMIKFTVVLKVNKFCYGLCSKGFKKTWPNCYTTLYIDSPLNLYNVHEQFHCFWVVFLFCFPNEKKKKKKSSFARSRQKAWWWTWWARRRRGGRGTSRTPRTCQQETIQFCLYNLV